MTRHGTHGGDDLLRCVGFQQQSARPGINDGTSDFVALVHRADQDLGRGRPGADAPYHFEAADARHGQVNHRHVGTQPQYQFDRLTAILRLASNLPAGFLLQQLAHLKPDQVVIVSEQNPQGGICGGTHRPPV